MEVPTTSRRPTRAPMTDAEKAANRAMTPDAVDAVLTAYLAAGDDSATAGLARISGSCPVARACRGHWHHLYTVDWFGIYPVAAYGYCVQPSKRLAAFVRWIDDSCGRRVTFAEARAIWSALSA